MKMTKGQGLSFFAAIIAFTVFTISLFILVPVKTIVFWLGYLFAVYALIVMFVSLFKFFNKKSNDETFLNIPVVIICWVYLIAQFYLSFKEMVAMFMPYTYALVANLLVGAFFALLILIVSATTNRTEKNNARIQEKILFVQMIKNDLQSIDTNDSTLAKKVENLIEEITYCDPMSHSKLESIENNIRDKVTELTVSVDDTEKALDLCDKIAKLMKNRNNQCMTLKNVKDDAVINRESGKGGGIAIAGVSAAFIITLGVLALIFYIVPNTKYKEACDLMHAEKYDEARAAFEEIRGFKDTNYLINQMETEENDYAYDEAIAFMEEGKYEDAIVAFEALEGYKDSNSKISEINDLIIEDKYQMAEQAFADGDYDTALGLYNEIAPYKDSNDRIVAINNRLSDEGLMYFGMYNGEAVAWRVVERDGYNKMLLLADQPIRNLPITDEITYTQFNDSDVATWLNGTFIEDFSSDDLARIIETDGLKVFLLSKKDVERLIDKEADLSSDTDWWLRTTSDTGFMYMTPDGTIEDAGDNQFKDKGVRPAIWVSLE